VTDELRTTAGSWSPSVAQHSLPSPHQTMSGWNGKTRCPLRHDLRDWLHRLDAHGEMRGDQLAESLNAPLRGYAGFIESDPICTTSMAGKMLSNLECGGWIVRSEVRRGVTRWVPGPNFNIKRFERWIAYGAPHDGAGQFPTDWDAKPHEQISLFDVEVAE
jgi:hypothetical protein